MPTQPKEMNPFLFHVIPLVVPITFQGSSSTSKEMSMLETPRILSCG
jgi:hypothetical protein